MIYELRTYEAAPGKLGALHARFRDHTLRIFARHGLGVVGFWTYAHGGWSDQLVYMMKFEDMADRARKWASFVADEEWKERRRRVAPRRPAHHAHPLRHPRAHGLLAAAVAARPSPPEGRGNDDLRAANLRGRSGQAGRT